MPTPRTFAEERMAKLQAQAARYEIRPDWVARMRQLEGFKIVVVADDSGSMGSIVTGGAATAQNPYAAQKTRWDELKESAGMIVELATCLDPEGVDVYFLNRQPLLRVTHAYQLAPAFAAPPAGFTPLSRTLHQVFVNTQHVLAEGKKLLVVIATDGQPTDDAGNVQINEFLSLLQRKPRGVFMQIMACTDDESTMSYLNHADESIPLLDVSDDYHSERREILRAQGQGFHFTYGDYVAKCLLGPIDPCALRGVPRRRNNGCANLLKLNTPPPPPQTSTSWTTFLARWGRVAETAAAPWCKNKSRLKNRHTWRPSTSCAFSSAQKRARRARSKGAPNSSSSRASSRSTAPPSWDARMRKGSSK
jgi:hypothetical protein